MALTNVLAVTIPWIELIAGLALIANVKPRGGRVVYTVLMTLFTVAVIAALARGLSFDCGCFGKSDAANLGAKKLLENVGDAGAGGRPAPGAARLEATWPEPSRAPSPGATSSGPPCSCG
jgi:hypothetical protein